MSASTGSFFCFSSGSMTFFQHSSCLCLLSSAWQDPVRSPITIAMSQLGHGGLGGMFISSS